MASHPNRSKKKLRPSVHLKKAAQLCSDIWLKVDQVRSERGKSVSKWPDWCFCPSGFISISDYIDNFSLVAFSAWRMTQSVYRFDKDIYSELIQQNVTVDDLATLYNMPEWCFYIVTQDQIYDGQVISGFYAFLDLSEDKVFLTLILVVADDSNEDTLKCERIDVSEGIKCPSLVPLVSLVLHLCGSVSFKSGKQPSKPLPKRTKNGWVIFTPDRPKIWDVIT
jgi:hypothetical protein